MKRYLLCFLKHVCEQLAKMFLVLESETGSLIFINFASRLEEQTR